MRVNHDSPLVSIITPVYNSAVFLPATLNSICNQTFRNFEHLIVDDGSTDESLSILERYSALDSRIKIIRLKGNNGPARARNAAIEKARGRYIAFIDSDDLWLPHKLESQLAFMAEKQAAVSFTSYFKMTEEGSDTGGVVNALDVVSYRDLLKSNFIGCSTALYDTQKVGKVFMPDILKRQDYALWLKITKVGHTAYGLSTPLVRYRVRETSVSSNKLVAAKYHWKVLREVEGLSYISSAFYFIQYAYLGIRKKRT
jgi:glycosyltransferase involved in cell wall biosynthesis